MSSELSDDESYYSLDEMRGWLAVEVRQVQLAAEARIREATRVVENYNAGQLSHVEANRQVKEHENKWGEASQDPQTASELHERAVNDVLRQRVKARASGNEPGQSR